VRFDLERGSFEDRKPSSHHRLLSWGRPYFRVEGQTSKAAVLRNRGPISPRMRLSSQMCTIVIANQTPDQTWGWFRGGAARQVPSPLDPIGPRWPPMGWRAEPPSGSSTGRPGCPWRHRRRVMDREAKQARNKYRKQSVHAEVDNSGEASCKNKTTPSTRYSAKKTLFLSRFRAKKEVHARCDKRTVWGLSFYD